MTVAPDIQTIQLRRDFLKAAKARRSPSGFFLLQARLRDGAEPPGLGTFRVGFTCSRKIGNAVVRNRARRRLRALAREVMPVHARPGWDYVLVARPQVTETAPFDAMCSALIRSLTRLHGEADPPEATGPVPEGSEPRAETTSP